MSRKERRSPRAERIRVLLDSGDHRAAREEARAVLRDESAPADERQGAATALASLSPDPGAVVAGAIGVAAAIVLAAIVLRGG